MTAFFLLDMKLQNTHYYTCTSVDMAHTTALERLCRICGKSTITKSTKTKYLCSEYDESLRSVFGVDTTEDSPTAHPQVFCHACKIVLGKVQSAGYKHRTVVFEGWSEHVDDSCHVCQHFELLHKGGHPMKPQYVTGRPRKDSPSYCIQHF